MYAMLQINKQIWLPRRDEILWGAPEHPVYLRIILVLILLIIITNKLCPFYIVSLLEPLRILSNIL